MKTLIAGAGAIGSYFGGRLLQAGLDVSFLVRPQRAAQLAAQGLVIRSPRGDTSLPAPTTLVAQQIRQPYDLVILACKAYDLESAIGAIAPAIGPETTILPLQNGLRHLDRLIERFGYGRVLGGLVLISATLDDSGAVQHLHPDHRLVFGELDRRRSARVDAIAAAFAPARFDSQKSEAIMQAMWEKWVHIATLAGATALMRASIGDIVRAGAQDVALQLLNECSRIAAHNGFAPGLEALGRTRAAITAPGSPLIASLLTDIEQGAPTESEHIIGDFLRRGRWSTADTVLLPLAHAQLRSYEARRAREAALETGFERLAA